MTPDARHAADFAEQHALRTRETPQPAPSVTPTGVR